MNESRYLRASQQIGFKTPLIDELTFVGRKREIRRILASIRGKQTTPIWIFGARRIGKSSLSYRLPKEEGLRIIRMSADGLEWEDIDAFAECVSKEASRQLSIKVNGTGKEILSELAGQTNEKQKLFIILDEFDRIAINLQKYEQALLRAILQQNPFFGIIFISRLRPEELLQDYSEENSRLIGICDIIRLPMLTEEEVCELIKIVGRFCGEEIPSWVSRWVYSLVGGYPVCVQSLLREILIYADEMGSFRSEKEIEPRGHLIFATVHDSLKSLWNDLPFGVRKILMGREEIISNSVMGELLSLNLFKEGKPLTPKWLFEIGNEEGVNADFKSFPEFIELGERLSNSIRNCNEIALRKGGTQVFQTTQQVFRLFEIARPVDSELTLNERINLLHKICVESTCSDNLPKEDRCLIPISVRHIYKKSEGYEILVSWRNFCFHDASHDLHPEEKSKRYLSMGNICCKYLGPGRIKPENVKDLNVVYKGILNDTVESVEKLEKALEKS